MLVKLYSKPRCGQCIATKRKMDSLGISYTYIDVSQDVEAFNYLQSINSLSMPRVETENDSWTGYNEKKIKDLAA